MITISDRNLEIIEKFKEMLSHSYFADSVQVTEVYNEVFGKNEPPTNCGTCIRQRMVALVGAMDALKADLARKEEAEREAFKEVAEQEKVEDKGKKKVGRPRKVK